MEFTVSITQEEIKAVGIVILTLVALAYIIPRAVFFFYVRSTSENTKSTLREIIYYLDEFADTMSKPDRRKNAIYRFQYYLSTKGVMLPNWIIGFVIDMEVKHIRYLQKTCIEDTNFHKDEEDNKEEE